MEAGNLSKIEEWEAVIGFITGGDQRTLQELWAIGLMFCDLSELGIERMDIRDSVYHFLKRKLASERRKRGLK